MKAGRLWPVSLLRWGGRQAVSSPGDRGRLPSPRFCRLGPVVLRGPRRSKVGKAFPPVRHARVVPPFRRLCSLTSCPRTTGRAVLSSSELADSPERGRRICSATVVVAAEYTPGEPPGRRSGATSRERARSVATRESCHPMSVLSNLSGYPGAPACVPSASRQISPTKRNAAPYQVPCQGTGAAWRPERVNVRCTR